MTHPSQASTVLGFVIEPDDDSVTLSLVPVAQPCGISSLLGGGMP